MVAMRVGDRSRSARAREGGKEMGLKNASPWPATDRDMSALYPLHREALVDIAADPAAIFAVLDDHSRLSAHMEKRSLMMAGATMKTELDSQRGQAVGSVIRMKGRVLGVSLHVEEVVTHYEPPVRKTWETRGQPRLLVIGRYRMGFELSRQPPVPACVSGLTTALQPAWPGAGWENSWARLTQSGA